MRFFLLFTVLFLNGKAQYLLKGKVIDSHMVSGIPFVSIGIPGKSIGTVSNEEGEFELQLDETSKHDSLVFMVMGYQTVRLAIAGMQFNEYKQIQLEPSAVVLEEVVVRPGKLKHKQLGVKNYSKTNCTGFTDVGNNWKGSEAAVLFHNNQTVTLEYFAFYIIQNKYPDSLRFRLKFYLVSGHNHVGQLIANKAVIFKVGNAQGEVKIPLSAFEIRMHGDFFVSLECLQDELDIRKFCYSGSLNVPSYYKVKAFSKWHSTRGTGNGGGGADFRVVVAY